MKISRRWLEDYVEFDTLEGSDFAELITTRVAEVDAYEVVGQPAAQAIVVDIVSVKPHPDKEKLSVVVINDGSQNIEVVCGAPNVRDAVNSKAAYVAPGGTIFPGGAEQGAQVEIREVAGFKSCGVLASEADLQLSSAHEGVLLLDESARAGERLEKYVGASDAIIEIDNKSVTHRPDLWCHAGFAREIAAVTGAKLKREVDRWADDNDDGAKLLAELGSGSPDVRVEIEPGSGCRRFAALEIEGVSTASSPLWLRRRLFAVGAGVRNVLVDLSNYVMHDIGQPNHAYDASFVKDGLLKARRAKAGERFVGLDEIERELDAEDIVIADGSGAVALGGVIGGLGSAVKASTSKLILESANFDPVLVRKTTKRYGLRTDASNRFEKSQSAYSVPLALQRYVELLTELHPEAKPAAKVVDCFLERPRSVQVPLKLDFVRSRLGADLGDEKICGILSSLRFGMDSRQNDEYLVDVPYFRATRDISIAEDLVEEVGRVYGYENIPEQAPLIESAAPQSDPLRQLEHTLRDKLSASGFYEISLYSFMGGKRAQQLGYSTQNTVALANPVSSEHDLMRSTLIPGLLAAVERNSRYFERFGLFEFGRSYEAQASGDYKQHSQESSPTFERRLMAIALSAPRDELQESSMLRPGTAQGAAWYTLRRELEDLLWGALGIKLSAGEFPAQPQESPASTWSDARTWMHPFRRALLLLGDTPCGIISEVRPDVLDDVSTRVICAELDVERLLAARVGNDDFTPIPKYPDSFFEVSVVMPRTRRFEELDELVRGAVDEGLLRGIELLGLYEGEPLAEDEKSISIKLLLGAPDRTLGGEELKTIQDSVVAAVESGPFALRS